MLELIWISHISHILFKKNFSSELLEIPLIFLSLYKSYHADSGTLIRFFHLLHFYNRSKMTEISKVK